jgi:Putative transposase, YhgA-like
MQENNTQPEETDEDLHHSGDKAFTIVMKVKESALEYLRTFFPKLYALLDTDNFELDDTNYVKEDFEEFYSGVVYRTYLKETPKGPRKPVSVVLLMEHKKSIESYFKLFLQLLEYIILIWREDLRNKRRPSVIIPIVVFQVKKGIRPKQLHDYFKGIPEELLAFIPNFKYFLTSVHGLPDADILALDKKGLLRTLFLAYTYAEKRDTIDNMLIEAFRCFKDKLPDEFKLFKFFFDFMSNEAYISPEERTKAFEEYLSPKQKEGFMNTYQTIRQEGLQEGEKRRTRLGVLRGRFRGISVDDLADQAELSLLEVENMLKGYDVVLRFWSSKRTDKKAIIEVAHLSEQEVRYLMNLFTEKLN